MAITTSSKYKAKDISKMISEAKTPYEKRLATMRKNEYIQIRSSEGADPVLVETAIRSLCNKKQPLNTSKVKNKR